MLGNLEFSGEMERAEAITLALQNGAEEIRTPLETPLKSALLNQGGAKSGALSISDPDLASIVDAWASLPEAMKTGILAMIRASNR